MTLGITWSFTRALQALPVRPTDAQAQDILNLLLTELNHSSDQFELWSLAQAMQALRVNLSNAQAQAAIDPILTAIEHTDNPIRLQVLARSLQVIAPKLTTTQAQAAIGPILAAIEQKATTAFAVRSLEQPWKHCPPNSLTSNRALRLPPSWRE
jgi:hypothetical protein